MPQNSLPPAAPAPTALERLPAEQTLLVSWPDGVSAKLPYLELRAQCMCARCVDEITGERIVDTDGIDPDIAIEGLQLVGSYAVKIRWTDGHDTGLYTWPHLRRLCAAVKHEARSTKHETDSKPE